MQENEKVDLYIYRIREQGLEVYLVEDQEAQWKTPFVGEDGKVLLPSDKFIELDPVTDDNGESRRAIAVEADWHELPSLRAMIYEDYRVAKEKAKEKIKNLIPDLEYGAFVAVKEAFKRVLPHQYAFLKELKDVLNDKNSTRYI